MEGMVDRIYRRLGGLVLRDAECLQVKVERLFVEATRLQRQRMYPSAAAQAKIKLAFSVCLGCGHALTEQVTHKSVRTGRMTVPPLSIATQLAAGSVCVCVCVCKCVCARTHTRVCPTPSTEREVTKRVPTH